MNSHTQKKKYGYKYRRSWYLRAIVIDQVNNRPVGRGPYHNIRSASWSIARFMHTMKELFPGATHVNFYDYKGTYQFQERFSMPDQIKQSPTKLQIGIGDPFLSITGENRYFNQVVFSQFDP